MPRLKLSSRFSVGPCVTTKGQVIKGAGSPGQHVWIGKLARSMSLPCRMISWQGAEATVLGFIATTVFSSGIIAIASRHPPGGSGCRKKASVSPIFLRSAGSRSIPHATRSTVPNRFAKTDISYDCPFDPITLSNNTAGPCSESNRV